MPDKTFTQELFDYYSSTRPDKVSDIEHFQRNINEDPSKREAMYNLLRNEGALDDTWNLEDFTSTLNDEYQPVLADRKAKQVKEKRQAQTAKVVADSGQEKVDQFTSAMNQGLGGYQAAPAYRPGVGPLLSQGQPAEGVEKKVEKKPVVPAATEEQMEQRKQREKELKADPVTPEQAKEYLESTQEMLDSTKEGIDKLGNLVSQGYEEPTLEEKVESAYQTEKLKREKKKHLESVGIPTKKNSAEIDWKELNKFASDVLSKYGYDQAEVKWYEGLEGNNPTTLTRENLHYNLNRGMVPGVFATDTKEDISKNEDRAYNAALLLEKISRHAQQETEVLTGKRSGGWQGLSENTGIDMVTDLISDAPTIMKIAEKFENGEELLPIETKVLNALIESKEVQASLSDENRWYRFGKTGRSLAEFLISLGLLEGLGVTVKTGQVAAAEAGKRLIGQVIRQRLKSMPGVFASSVIRYPLTYVGQRSFAQGATGLYDMGAGYSEDGKYDIEVKRNDKTMAGVVAEDWTRNAVMMSMFGLFGAINDPVMGYIAKSPLMSKTIGKVIKPIAEKTNSSVLRNTMRSIGVTSLPVNFVQLPAADLLSSLSVGDIDAIKNMGTARYWEDTAVSSIMFQGFNLMTKAMDLNTYRSKMSQARASVNDFKRVRFGNETLDKYQADFSGLFDVLTAKGNKGFELSLKKMKDTSRELQKTYSEKFDEYEQARRDFANTKEEKGSQKYEAAREKVEKLGAELRQYHILGEMINDVEVQLLYAKGMTEGISAKFKDYVGEFENETGEGGYVTLVRMKDTGEIYFLLKNKGQMSKLKGMTKDSQAFESKTNEYEVLASVPKEQYVSRVVTAGIDAANMIEANRGVNDKIIQEYNARNARPEDIKSEGQQVSSMVPAGGAEPRPSGTENTAVPELPGAPRQLSAAETSVPVEETAERPGLPAPVEGKPAEAPKAEERFLYEGKPVEILSEPGEDGSVYVRFEDGTADFVDVKDITTEGKTETAPEVQTVKDEVLKAAEEGGDPKAVLDSTNLSEGEKKAVLEDLVEEQTGQQAQTGAPANAEQSDIRRTPEGDIDYDDLMQRDPQRFVQEFDAEFGPGAALERIKAIANGLDAEIAKLQKSLEKPKSMNDAAKMLRQLKTLTEQKEALDAALTPKEEVAPVEEAKPEAAAPIEAPKEEIAPVAEEKPDLIGDAIGGEVLPEEKTPIEAAPVETAPVAEAPEVPAEPVVETPAPVVEAPAPQPEPVKETPKPKTAKKGDIVAERKKKVDKKFTMYDYAHIDKNFPRPVMEGVFLDSDGGWAVASDAHILIAAKAPYDSKYAGKIIRKDGKEIEGKYPDWKKIFNKNVHPAGVDYATLYKQIEALEEAKKNLPIDLKAARMKKKDIATYVPIVSDGKTYWFRSDLLQSYLDAMVHFGVDASDIMLHEDTKKAMQVNTEKARGLLMPTRQPFGKQPSFYIPKALYLDPETGEIKINEELQEKINDYPLQPKGETEAPRFQKEAGSSTGMNPEELQSYIDTIKSEDATICTREDIIEQFQKDGVSEDNINKVQGILDDSKQDGSLVRGIMVDRRVYLIADDIDNVEEGREAYVHERQHVISRKEDLFRKYIQGGRPTAEEMLDIINKIDGTGNLYEGASWAQLLDEAISEAMALAYTVPVEEFENALRERGIDNDYFINFVKNLNDEQSKDSLLSKARRRNGRNDSPDVSVAGGGPEGSGAPESQSGEIQGETAGRAGELQGSGPGEGRIGNAEPVTSRRKRYNPIDRGIRNAISQKIEKAGIPVITDEAEGQAVLDAAKAAEVRKHAVWHGSGSLFEEFDHSHMGEGEGMQAYGWGTYVTEVKGIGKAYAESSAKRSPELQKELDELMEETGRLWDEWQRVQAKTEVLEENVNRLQRGIISLEALNGLNEEQYKDFIKRYITDIDAKYPEGYEGVMDEDVPPELEDQPPYVLYAIEFLHTPRGEEYMRDRERLDAKEMNRLYQSMRKELENSKEEFIKATYEQSPLYFNYLRARTEQGNPKYNPSSYLYEVEIPDDNGNNYITYGKELSPEQTRQMKDAVRQRLLSDPESGYDETNLRELNNDLNKFDNISGEAVVGSIQVWLGVTDKEASEFLSNLGYVGIKYPAQFRTGGRSDNASNFVIFNEGDLKIKSNIKLFKSEDGKEIYGFTKDGKIYLDPNAPADTPIHEYTHLWSEMFRKLNPKEWENITELMKKTGLWDKVKENYPELTEESDLAEEVLSYYSGKRGAERLKAEMKRISSDKNLAVSYKMKALKALQNLRNAIEKFWRTIAEYLGIKFTTAEEVADRVLADIDRGINPKEVIKAVEESQPMFTKAEEVLSFFNKRGFKNGEIVRSITDHGVSIYIEGRWGLQDAKYRISDHGLGKVRAAHEIQFDFDDRPEDIFKRNIAWNGKVFVRSGAEKLRYANYEKLLEENRDALEGLAFKKVINSRLPLEEFVKENEEAGKAKYLQQRTNRDGSFTYEFSYSEPNKAKAEHFRPSMKFMENFEAEDRGIRLSRNIEGGEDVKSIAGDLYRRYENQNGKDLPWMSEEGLIDKIEDELPQTEETERIFSLIDTYRELEEIDFEEGKRDFAGGEKDDVFEKILSELSLLGEEGGIRFSKAYRDTIDESKQTVQDKTEAAKVIRKAKLDEANGKVGGMVRRTIQTAQRGYDRAMVDIIADMARDLMKEDLIDNPTKMEMQKVITLLSNTTAKEKLEGIAHDLMDIMVDNQLRNYSNLLSRFEKMKIKKKDQSGVVAQGSLGLFGQKAMDAFKEWKGANIDDLDTRMDDVLARMHDAEGEEYDELMAEYGGLEVAYNFLKEIKESKEKETALKADFESKRKDLYKDYKDGKITFKNYSEFLKNYRETLLKMRADRADAYRKVCGQLQQIVVGGKLEGSIFRQMKKDRADQIFHNANSDMKGMRRSEHSEPKGIILNSWPVRWLTTSLPTYDMMFRAIGYKSPKGEGYSWDYFVRNGWITAAETEYVKMQEGLDAIENKLQELMGLNVNGLYGWNRAQKSPIVARFFDGGEMKDHELSQLGGLYIYMVNKMTDGKMTLRAMGIDQDAIDEMVSVIDPRLIKFADWVQSEFLPGLRERYNQVHEKLFGASMDAIEEYFPLKRNKNSRKSKVEMETFDQQGLSIVTGAIKKRTKNTVALDIMNNDALSVLLSHVREMEHWAAFAQLSEDLRTLLSYNSFRNAFRNMRTPYGTGERLLTRLEKVCQIAVGQYKKAGKISEIDELGVVASRGVTAGKIAFRIFTAWKQIYSAPAFLADADPLVLMKNFGLMFTGKTWNWCIDNLPLFQKRWKSRIAGDTRLFGLDSDYKAIKRHLVKSAARLGMTPNAFMDGLTISVGAKSIYDVKRRRYIREGFPVETAEEMARRDANMYNESQQSAESAFVAPIQVDRTFFSAALTVFRNASMGYTRQAVDAAWNITKMLTPGYRKESVEQTTKQLIRQGLEAEQAERAAKKRYNRGYAREAIRLAVYGWLLPYLWYLAAHSIYSLFGDNEKKAEDNKKKAQRRAWIGPVEGFAGGNVIATAWDLFMNDGNTEYFDTGTMPITSDVENIIRLMGRDKVSGWNEVINFGIQAGIGINPATLTDAICAISDAVNGDMETTKEVLLCIAKIFQVPKSDIEQLYIDELDMKGGEALKLTPGELAKRYAREKVRREAFFTGQFYDDAERKDIEGKKAKGFLKKVAEREKLQEPDEFKAAEDDIKAFNKTLSQLKKDLKEAETAELREEARAALNEFMQAPEYKDYLRKKGLMGQIKSKEKIMKAAQEGDRQKLQREIDSLRQEIIKINEEKPE